MNTAETIQQKIVQLPSQAQEEVLKAVEEIELRYQSEEKTGKQNGDRSSIHALTFIAEIAVDAGVSDLAERHDFYAHRKLED